MRQPKHGWTEAMLRERLTAARVLLAECESTSHPMKAAMVEGQRKVISNIEAHLSEFDDIAPDLAAAGVDTERESKLDAERVTLQFGVKSNRKLDAGRKCIEDSPLFGGERQSELF